MVVGVEEGVVVVAAAGVVSRLSLLTGSHLYNSTLTIGARWRGQASLNANLNSSSDQCNFMQPRPRDRPCVRVCNRSSDPVGGRNKV